MNFAGSELNSNFIIIVNDNQQSIAENHGGLYKNLDELRETNGQASNNLFKAMGLDYIYEADGNNIRKMIELFQKIKDIDHPVSSSHKYYKKVKVINLQKKIEKHGTGLYHLIKKQET